MIGFLFLSYQDITQKTMWSQFFSAAPKDQYLCFVHRKDGETTSWLPNSTCIPTMESAWGAWSLVEIEFALYRKAIDAGCDHVILLSGDCVPLVTFQHVVPRMEDNLQSCRLGLNQSRSRFMRNKDLMNVGKFQWWGASQWKILSRASVITILNDYSLIHRCFAESVIPDEHAIPMYMISRKMPFTNRDFCVADFTLRSKKCPHNGEMHRIYPKTWHKAELTSVAIDNFISKGCLFLRKTCNFETLDFKLRWGVMDPP